MTVRHDAQSNAAIRGYCRARDSLSAVLGEYDENEPDDYSYIPDYALGRAPTHPGTWEGDQGKPLHPSERLNKWCVRECERSEKVPIGDTLIEIQLPDFNRPIYNMPKKHE